MFTISIDPIIFQIGHFALRWYGLIVLIAIQAGIWLIAREADRKGFKKDDFYGAAMWIIIAGILGARLFHVLDHWRADAVDRERQTREEEIKRQGRNLIVAGAIGLIVMIGTFYDMLGPFKAYIPEFLSYKWVIGLLTTPIVFGPGRQFFTNSWRGLKHGVTDMNLLYATGIGAAYGSL